MQSSVQQVQELKEQQGRDIVVTGSITLCHTLINAGLVDEYRLFVYPSYRAGVAGYFPMGLRSRGLSCLRPKASAAASRTPDTVPSDHRAMV